VQLGQIAFEVARRNFQVVFKFAQVTPDGCKEQEIIGSRILKREQLRAFGIERVCSPRPWRKLPKERAQNRLGKPNDGQP
jgi:hypothetical protein